MYSIMTNKNRSYWMLLQKYFHPIVVQICPQQFPHLKMMDHSERTSRGQHLHFLVFEVTKHKCSLQKHSKLGLVNLVGGCNSQSSRQGYLEPHSWYEFLILGCFGQSGAAEKKNPNCHKYATFEGSFFCLKGQNNIVKKKTCLFDKKWTH